MELQDAFCNMGGPMELNSLIKPDRKNFLPALAFPSPEVAAIRIGDRGRRVNAGVLIIGAEPTGRGTNAARDQRGSRCLAIWPESLLSHRR